MQWRQVKILSSPKKPQKLENGSGGGSWTIQLRVLAGTQQNLMYSRKLKYTHLYQKVRCQWLRELETTEGLSFPVQFKTDSHQPTSCDKVKPVVPQLVR